MTRMASQQQTVNTGMAMGNMNQMGVASNSLALPSPNPMAAIPDSQNLFKQLGDKHVTDKVTAHRYHPVYEKYFRYQRENSNLRVLEIGLGCNMAYGPGHSIPVWKEYFPKMQALFIVEYTRDCALRFKDQVTEMFIGDQSDLAFMDGVGKKAGPLDFVVDDGGHTMKQMRNTLIALLKYVRPGGVYFTEDLHAAYEPGHAQDNGPDTMITLIKEIEGVMHDTNKASPHSDLAKSLADLVEYIECWREICAFVRKA